MMRLREDGAHLFAFLLIGEPAHGGLEKEDAKDGKKDYEFEHDKPHQRLSPGHILESIPVQGIEKREYAPRLGHKGISLR